MELGKRDPQGYYVILARTEALELVKDALIEEAGDCLIVRIKSKSKAQRLLKKLLALDLLCA